MKIPNIIDSSVPIGKDDSENVEIEKFGEPFVPDYEISYHKWRYTVSKTFVNHKVSSIGNSSFM